MPVPNVYRPNAYRFTRSLLLGAAALSLVAGIPAGAQVAQNDAARIQAVTPRPGAPGSFADLAQTLQPAVVNISTRQKVKVETQNPFAGTPFEGLFGGQTPQGQTPQTREAQSLGSGFIISADGYVVTNNHVITADGKGEAISITVTLPDGSEYPAKVIGKDAASDLAVLKITAPKPLPFVKFGDSRSARVGDWVIAIGNPFGLGGTVTAGIVSAVHRATGSGAYDSAIQTDAAINRGNSGGPMFDMSGQVIGINNAIFSPNGGSIGIGFAIPSETAAPIVERLVKGQAIERGYLGVHIQPLSDDMADSLGLAHHRGEFVQSVEPGKAAAKAGMQPGDVVVKVKGSEVSPEQTLSYLVANTPPGTAIPLELIRNGQHIALTVTVGKRPSEEELSKQSFEADPQDGDNPPSQQQKDASSAVENVLGFSVLALTPQIAMQLGVAEDLHGAVVSGVDATSDAAAKGLQRGDIVLSANYHPVNSAADIQREIHAAQAANRPAVLLQVLRRGQPTTYVPVRLK